MTKDAVHSRSRALPFIRFSLRLMDGTLIPVPHPDFMSLSQVRPDDHLNTAGEKFSIVDLGFVTTIELGS